MIPFYTYLHDIATPSMNRRNTRLCQLCTNAVQNVKNRIDAYPEMVAFFLPMRSAKRNIAKFHSNTNINRRRIYGGCTPLYELF